VPAFSRPAGSAEEKQNGDIRRRIRYNLWGIRDKNPAVNCGGEINVIESHRKSRDDADGTRQTRDDIGIHPILAGNQQRVCAFRNIDQLIARIETVCKVNARFIVARNAPLHFLGPSTGNDENFLSRSLQHSVLRT
jgi:hypothetical protein